MYEKYFLFNIKNTLKLTKINFKVFITVYANNVLLSFKYITTETCLIS
jgi:hypothetical protein